jgi:hypothetical protein
VAVSAFKAKFRIATASHMDRTTLTPLAGGRVHQVIEISRDGGKNWETVFDAEYRQPL